MIYYILFCSIVINVVNLRIAQCQSKTVTFQSDNLGTIKGKTVEVDGKSYGVFQAIPYAKPPIGKLRFKDPQPLDKTKTNIDATKGYSKMCVQTYYSSNNQSEDCLYLNVFTPKTASGSSVLYPVMVGIHGGGLIVGSASSDPVNGVLKNLVSRGVVYVAMNYRLNSFGFFTTESSVAPGNAGFLDQVMSLQWVKDNIRTFGGDPSKVTIFGESAGGASVSLLTISPLAKGLFNQAIMMSGSAYSPFAMRYDNDQTTLSESLSHSVGCAQAHAAKPKPKCGYENLKIDLKTLDRDAATLKQHQTELDCLQSKSVDEIAKSEYHQTLGWAGRVGGHFLTDVPSELMKKRENIKMMIGVTKHEWATFAFTDFPGLPPGLVFNETKYFSIPEPYITCRHYKYPALVNFTAKYHYANTFNVPPLNTSEARWFSRDVKIKSATMFWMPAYRDTVSALRTKNTVYLYSWDFENAMDFYDPKTNFYWKGAPHASELFPLYATNDFPAYFSRDGKNSRRDKSFDKKAEETFGLLWTNFAKFGNPTPDKSFDGITWEPVNADKGNYLSIDMPKSQMKNDFYSQDVEFWKYVEQLQDSVECY